MFADSLQSLDLLQPLDRHFEVPARRQSYEGHDIVCFANDWSGDPLSKKHVMTRLAKKNRVLWVNSLGNRAPKASARDMKRIVD
ncbi:MAG: hypothetical protein ACXVDD_18665, partial [Polyangia bacterium]